MKKLFIFLFLSFPVLTTNKTLATEQPELLIKLQNDIFSEIMRSHGSQIQEQTVLSWCQFEGLAEEIGLSVIGLKRAVYDSFIVAGSQNVQATEIARQMRDDEWDLYNNALFSDIKRYQAGIKKGLDLSHPQTSDKETFCQHIEQQALKTAQTIAR